MVAKTEVTAAENKRTISGIAVPYNELGRTSRGSLQLREGALSLPEKLEHIKLWRDHSDSGGTPVGYCTAADSTPAGLKMAFKIAETADGDTALKDVQQHVRDALSVEMCSVSVDGDTITAADLTGVAIVPTPAFSTARIESVTAAHSLEKDTTMTKTTHTTKERVAEESGKTTAASAPAGLVTGTKAKPEELTLETVTAALAADIGAHSREDWVTAALQDVTYSANPAVRAPGWLGKLWEGNTVTRRIIPTMTQKSLTGVKMSGWRWTEKPEVDDYAGDKAEIPSGPVSTEAVNLVAKRLAGGHDFDRAYFDFGDTEFIAAYLQAMAASYAVKSDQRAMSWLAAESENNKGTQQPSLLYAAAWAKMQMEDDINASPTSYLVNPLDAFDLLKITKMDQPEYLDLIGVDPKSFQTSKSVKQGTVLAYAKPAVEFYELAGSPIRVDVEDLRHGGRDEAVFGYYATNLTTPKGIIQVPFGAE